LKAKNIAGAMQIRSSERFSSVSWVDQRGANCEAAVNLADLYRQPTAMIVSRAALLSSRQMRAALCLGSDADPPKAYAYVLAVALHYGQVARGHDRSQGKSRSPCR